MSWLRDDMVLRVVRSAYPIPTFPSHRRFANAFNNRAPHMMVVSGNTALEIRRASNPTPNLAMSSSPFRALARSVDLVDAGVLADRTSTNYLHRKPGIETQQGLFHSWRSAERRFSCQTSCLVCLNPGPRLWWCCRTGFAMPALSEGWLGGSTFKGLSRLECLGIWR
jgi:hypothetical protein